MKNTFAVTMTLLLALTLGGSYGAYKIATNVDHGAAAHSTETHSTETPNAEAGAEAATETASTETSTETANTETVSAATGEEASAGETSTEEMNAETTPGAAEGGETGQTPEEMAAAAAPAGDAEAGKELFASATCAACHGANAEGGAVGPTLKPAVDWSDADFITALRTGKTPTRELAATMPRFGEDRLTDSDLTNIHAYVKSVQ